MKAEILREEIEVSHQELNNLVKLLTLYGLNLNTINKLKLYFHEIAVIETVPMLKENEVIQQLSPPTWMETFAARILHQSEELIDYTISDITKNFMASILSENITIVKRRGRQLNDKVNKALDKLKTKGNIGLIKSAIDSLNEACSDIAALEAAAFLINDPLIGIDSAKCESLLYLSINNVDLRNIKVLCILGARLNDPLRLNQVFTYNALPLQILLENSFIDIDSKEKMASILVKYGANPFQFKKFQDNSPIGVAIFHGYTNIVEAFLKSKGSYEPKNLYVTDIRNRSQWALAVPLKLTQPRQHGYESFDAKINMVIYLFTHGVIFNESKEVRLNPTQLEIIKKVSEAYNKVKNKDQETIKEIASKLIPIESYIKQMEICISKEFIPSRFLPTEMWSLIFEKYAQSYENEVSFIRTDQKDLNAVSFESILSRVKELYNSHSLMHVKKNAEYYANEITNHLILNYSFTHPEQHKCFEYMVKHKEKLGLTIFGNQAQGL
jgi:hypothetical protein